MTGSHSSDSDSSSGTKWPRESGVSPAALKEPDLPYAGFTWSEIGIIGGVAVLLAAISFLQALNSPCCAPETQAELFRSGTRRLLGILLWVLAALSIFWACVRLHPRTRGPGLQGWGAVLGGHLLLAAFIPIIVDVGYEAIRAGVLTLWPPSDPPSSSVFNLSETITDLEFLDELVPYLILLVVGMGRHEYVRSRARQERAEALEREAQQLRSKLTAARLESLRMQINPHFFHNTLHTISTMAGRDPEGIRRATARLSDLMRYVLSTSDQQEVPLDEELDVLESYLDIQKLRLDDRLEVSMDIDPAARTALVPTLLLQPLAENAVKHGFEGVDEAGHLHVRAARDGDTLALEVADDGKGLSDAAVESSEIENGAPLRDGQDSHGIDNIAERLEGLYGDEASLQFKRSEEGGLRVIIRLPFRTRDSDHTLRASGVVAD